jgi:hypothetical protein
MLKIQKNHDLLLPKFWEVTQSGGFPREGGVSSFTPRMQH